MSTEKKEASKYYVKEAHYSAIGDYANVNNNFPAQLAAQDAGMAELRQLFEKVNQQLATLSEDDRAAVTPVVEQTSKTVAAIQQGDESQEKQSFLEKRLKAIYNMSGDIGEVLITTLASPAAGIALTIKKIAQKALADLNIGQHTDGAAK